MTTITIKFQRARSPHWLAAVKIAEAMDAEKLGNETYRIIHMIDVAHSDLPRLSQLYRIVGKWKATHVTIDGPGNSLGLPELIRQIERVQLCHNQQLPGKLVHMYCSKKASPTADAACFGCRLMAGLQRLPGWQYDPLAWWSFGELNDDLSAFNVDKDTVKVYLHSRGTDQVCTLCPTFSWAAVDRDVDALPDTVMLDEQSPFCIAYSQLDPLTPIGIKPREQFATRAIM